MGLLRRFFTWLIAGLTFSVLIAVFCVDFTSLWEAYSRPASAKAVAPRVIIPPAPRLPSPMVARSESRNSTVESNRTADSEQQPQSVAKAARPTEAVKKIIEDDLPEVLPEFSSMSHEVGPSFEAAQQPRAEPAKTSEFGPHEAPVAAKIAAHVSPVNVETPIKANEPATRQAPEIAPQPKSAEIQSTGKEKKAEPAAAPEKSTASVKATLTKETTTPGVATATDSTAGSAAIAKSAERASVPATETAQHGALPDWMQRLPEIVASVPRNRPIASQSDEATLPKVYPNTSDAKSLSSLSKLDPTAEVGTAVAESRPVTQHVDDSWCEPEALVENLRELAKIGPSSKWANEALRQIHAFGSAVNSHSENAGKLLARLAELEQQSAEVSANIADPNLSRRVRKAGYALGRRINVWQQVVQIGASKSASASVPGCDPARLAKCLEDIDVLFAKSGEGVAWRQYLMLDALKECADQPKTLREPFAREIARQVLVRMTQTPLTPEQRRFITGGPLAVLQSELLKWTAEPVGVATVLRDIERYERSSLPSDATRVATERQHLMVSSSDKRQALATHLDAHYRNANLRITVTEKLLNQLIPEQNLEYSPVNDVVQGRPTSGESVTATKLGVRMIPDPKRVLLAMEVQGEVAAQTATDAGVVRVHNDSELNFVAYKPMEISMSGIKVWPVEIDVQNESRIRGIETSLDAPVIGFVIRGIAKSQAESAKSAANAEVREKIAAKVTERIDAEARKQLKGVVEKMNQRVFDPLNSLALDPVMVDAETTKDRFTMRLLVGGEDQLGSHTPRPQAPSDSLASVQLHESVLNNGIQRLQLDGRAFMLPELAQHIATRLSLPETWETSPDNEDVKIIFADRDALTVRCEEGQVAVTLSIAQLSKGSRKWHNFQVRAFYKPEINGRSAELVRDGVIHLMGQRISAGSQIALRGIFARVFSRKSPWQLIPEQFVKDAQLKELAITQFVIDDGWIGLAFGPKPVANNNTARRQRWQ